jgi:hypothetical protein
MSMSSTDSLPAMSACNSTNTLHASATGTVWSDCFCWRLQLCLIGMVGNAMGFKCVAFCCGVCAAASSPLAMSASGGEHSQFDDGNDTPQRRKQSIPPKRREVESAIASPNGIGNGTY